MALGHKMNWPNQSADLKIGAKKQRKPKNINKHRGEAKERAQCLRYAY